jgi:hypothetical protein
MSDYSSNEQYAKVIRQKIVSTAKAMLVGELDFLLGSRILASLKYAVAAKDDDFMVFVGIASEIDNFPLDDVQQHWDPQSLIKLQPDINAARIWARKCGEEPCASLIARFNG